MESILTTYIEDQLRDLGEDATVEPDDDLVLIGFDSIAYVRLVAFLNERFGVRVPDSDVTVEQFGTVARIAVYLEGRGVSADAGADS